MSFTPWYKDYDTADEFYQWAESQGYTGTVDDKLREYLTDLGFTGAISDMWYAWHSSASLLALLRASTSGFFAPTSSSANLFQTSSSISPSDYVANSDPVGLIIDPLSGVDITQTLGPDLIEDPTFTDTDFTGWNIYRDDGGDAVISLNGSGNLLVTGSAQKGIEYEFATEIGKTYLVEGQIAANTNTFAIRDAADGLGTTPVTLSNFASSGLQTAVFTATQTSYWAQLRRSGASIIEVIQFRVREISRTFTGPGAPYATVGDIPGNHLTQATLADRPTWNESEGALEFDGVSHHLVVPDPSAVGVGRLGVNIKTDDTAFILYTEEGAANPHGPWVANNSNNGTLADKTFIDGVQIFNPSRADFCLFLRTTTGITLYRKTTLPTSLTEYV